MAEVSGEPFVSNAVFESYYGFGVRTVDYLVLFSKKHVPKLSGRLSGLLSYMTQIVRIRRSDISPLKICPKGVFELFPTSNEAFGEAFKPVRSWPFELEG